ncbi:MAG TPA: zf-TFIIB domain-containing protein [Candidatus Binataceae bacterium]|nr:zf-TFIIB domain-containing protein [Candidatus Binataceae bacterium]
MATDEKDRLGNKLHDVEAARENEWARKRDAELLAKLRDRQHAMACPHCNQPLVEKTERGVRMMACPTDEGAWLDANELKGLLPKKK